MLRAIRRELTKLLRSLIGRASSDGPDRPGRDGRAEPDDQADRPDVVKGDGNDDGDDQADSSDGSDQDDNSDSRLAAGDRPLFEAVDGVSLNEAHAALEGAAVGWLAAWSGRETVAVVAAVVAVGWPGRGPIGLRTLRREPWWALVGLVVGVVVGERAAFADS